MCFLTFSLFFFLFFSFLEVERKAGSRKWSEGTKRKQEGRKTEQQKTTKFNFLLSFIFFPFLFVLLSFFFFFSFFFCSFSFLDFFVFFSCLFLLFDFDNTYILNCSSRLSACSVRKISSLTILISHNLTVWSALPEASTLPLTQKSRSQTVSLCP